jgi:pimeloyl-ACP methyl ester carboxylesterase
MLAALALMGTGRRVVAPWLRGYSPSPLSGPYDLDTLAADALAWIDALAGPARRVDLVGHDWGAAITYRVCATEPARVRRAATLAVPHPLTLLRRVPHPAQLRRSWYMLLFQLPGAELVARARSLALVDRLWRAWSPRLALAPEQRAALHACLAASLPAPLGYYRALVRPLSTLGARIRGWPSPIETPLLQLHGADDGCVLPPTTADAAHFRDRVLEVIPNAGHFVHVEEPGSIAARLAAWLS